jgi:hypothetical protein
MGELVFPDVLLGLNHEGLEVTLKQSKRLKLSPEIETIDYPDGAVYVGELLDGERHGQGTMTYENGDTYVGEWENDKRHGQGKMKK